MLDRKGIAWFLGITFSSTFLVEFLIVGLGVRFDENTNLWARYVIMAVMWIPAAAALITTRWITREGFGGLGVSFGPGKAYVTAMFLVPLLFAVIYGLTWLLGLGAPDWQMVSFLNLMKDLGSDVSSAPPPTVIYPALFVSSVFIAPLLNGLFGFGEELGWRGYLLPKLMPLGKPAAYSLLGVIWGLWHLPLLLVGFNYGAAPAVLSVLTFVALTTVLGVTFNEARLRTGSSVLAGWLHGVFNSQRLGMWYILFPAVSPLLGGPVGWLGIAVWGVVALISIYSPAWLGLSATKRPESS